MEEAYRQARKRGEQKDVDAPLAKASIHTLRTSIAWLLSSP